MVRNPFVLSANIPAEFFCDREKETERLIQLLINHNNVTLISPRRMGKSGLINHCFQKKELRENYVTLYVDILQTSSFKEFVYLFGKAVYDNIVPKTSKWIQKFFQNLKSLNGKISFDAITGLPTFNMTFGEIINPGFTLDEIFGFIRDFDKRCIIAIDEFQQITRYPEKNVEEILRTHIQQQNQANFIFSGSERHIMSEMFLSYSRPFYNSTAIMTLEAIPEEKYMEFAKYQFKKYGKEIGEEAVHLLYKQFEGYTYYLQKSLNEAFFQTAENGICDRDNLRKAIEGILEDNSTKFREILSNIPERQKDLLYAIAIEGEAGMLTSSAFIKKYNLLSASSVQAATKALLDKDYITKLEGRYSLTDKFLSLWIKMIYGPNFILLG
ncbi:MAG: ATP-binding protein [Muribaculaceae bacterium]|nr:ATP-binding protein [Muribaculaceae bacterium]